MKKNIAVFLIVFSFLASAGIILEQSISPYLRDLARTASAFTSQKNPPAQTPAVAIGRGDVDNDGAVSFTDLWFVIQGWDTKDSALDQYADGKINMMDASVVISNIK